MKFRSASYPIGFSLKGEKQGNLPTPPFTATLDSQEVLASPVWSVSVYRPLADCLVDVLLETARPFCHRNPDQTTFISEVDGVDGHD